MLQVTAKPHGGQGGLWDPGVRLVPPNATPSSVTWQLTLIQAKKVVQELGHLFHCPAPGGQALTPHISSPTGKINEPLTVPVLIAPLCDSIQPNTALLCYNT